MKGIKELFKQADEYSNQKQHAGAVKCYTQILEIETTNSTASLEKAKSLFELFRYKEAFDLLNSISDKMQLKYEDQSDKDWIKLFCLYLLGQGEQALDLTAKILRSKNASDEEKATLLNGIASIHTEEGNIDKAAFYYDTAIIYLRSSYIDNPTKANALSILANHYSLWRIEEENTDCLAKSIIKCIRGKKSFFNEVVESGNLLLLDHILQFRDQEELFRQEYPQVGWPQGKFLSLEAYDNHVSSLAYAAKNSTLAMVKMVYQQGGIAVNDIADSQGRTALFYAVEANRVDITKFLLAQNANIFHLDDEGNNIFHLLLNDDGLGKAPFKELICEILKYMESHSILKDITLKGTDIEKLQEVVTCLKFIKNMAEERVASCDSEEETQISDYVEDWCKKVGRDVKNIPLLGEPNYDGDNEGLE